MRRERVSQPGPVPCALAAPVVLLAVLAVFALTGCEAANQGGDIAGPLFGKDKPCTPWPGCKDGGGPSTPTGTMVLSGGFTTPEGQPQAVDINVDNNVELRVGKWWDENEQFTFTRKATLTATYAVLQAALDALPQGSTVVPDGRLYEAQSGELLCIFATNETPNPPPEDVPLDKAQELVDRLVDDRELERGFTMRIMKADLGWEGDHSISSETGMVGYSKQFPDRVTVVEDETDVFTFSEGVIRTVGKWGDTAPVTILKMNCPNQGDIITAVLVRDEPAA